MFVRLHTVNLSVGYQNPLLNKLNLDLTEGSITCLIGRNGAGKSTLIRTLCGMQKPLGGKISIDNIMMETMSEKEIAKRLSVVLTDPIKTPYMTVEELVVFGRYPYLGGQIRLTTEDWNIVTSAIQDAGIESLRNRQITTLSDGERQKTMLARSLAQQTTFIILDEPAAFLDFPSKIELMQLLKNLAINLKKSILLSTHDIEMAIALADNIWLIDKNSHFISEKPDILLNNHVISKTFDIPDSFFDTTEQRYNFLNKSHF